MAIQYRHGDVFIERVDALPADAVKRARGEREDVILAEGEVTGHAHRVKTRTVALWDADGQRYLTVEAGGASVTHEEHKQLDLPEGCYRILIQREYAPDAIRNVAD